MSHTVVTEQFLRTLTVTAGSDAGSWSEQIKVSLLSQAIPNAGSVAHCHSNQSRLAVTALIHVGPVTQHVNGRSVTEGINTVSLGQSIWMQTIPNDIIEGSLPEQSNVGPLSQSTPM